MFVKLIPQLRSLFLMDYLLEEAAAPKRGKGSEALNSILNETNDEQ